MITLETEAKKFHFMEIDLIVYFPKCGNKGKYLGYDVIVVDRKKGAMQSGKQVKLKEVLEDREFESLYPHTVGFYKESLEEGAEFKPEYLEIRKINDVEEFWLFLNSLDI
jgi:hypothetical protein